MQRTRSAEVCEDCGKPVFFNHSMWSSSPDGGGGSYSHGPGDDACAKAAEAIERMPLLVDVAIQSIIEIQEITSGDMFSGSEEEWADVRRLQKTVATAYNRSVLAIDELSAALAGRKDSADA